MPGAPVVPFRVRVAELEAKLAASEATAEARASVALAGMSAAELRRRADLVALAESHESRATDAGEEAARLRVLAGVPRFPGGV